MSDKFYSKYFVDGPQNLLQESLVEILLLCFGSSISNKSATTRRGQKCTVFPTLDHNDHVFVLIKNFCHSRTK